MKRLIIAVCMLVTGIAISIGGLLGVYTNHSEMDELMMLMKQIRQLSTDKDYDELIEKCRESIYRFEHIAETETPSFGNVF